MFKPPDPLLDGRCVIECDNQREGHRVDFISCSKCRPFTSAYFLGYQKKKSFFRSESTRGSNCAKLLDQLAQVRWLLFWLLFGASWHV